MREAIDEPVSAIVDSVIACLGQAPPELAQDLIDPRACTSSAAAACSAASTCGIERETEVPVHLVDAPLECVVLGAGHCIESYEALKVMFLEARR